MTVALHDRVALRRDFQELHLRAGDVASVVDVVPHPSAGGEGCVFEVFNVLGDSIAVVTVPRMDVEPLPADDVLTVRRLASQSMS